MIDAVLKLAGLSETFTQDIEDMVQMKNEKPDVKPEDTISTVQVQRLHQRIRTLALSLQRVNHWLSRAWGIHAIEQLPKHRFDTLMGKLDLWAEQEKTRAQQRRA